MLSTQPGVVSRPTSGIPLPPKINARVLALEKAFSIVSMLGDGALGGHARGLTECHRQGVYYMAPPNPESSHLLTT